MNNSLEIPKIIHLCWFSGDEYPEIIKKCIKSWEQTLPDFKIKIWTKEMALETNIKFVKEAISVQKWAFAADVIRLYALYTEGGVYMDSDIAIRNRFDTFMTNQLVLFQEFHKRIVKNSKNNSIDKNGNNKNHGQSVDGIGIQAAFMISVKGHPFIKELLSYYENLNFIHDDGSFHMNIIAPSIYAIKAEEIGYKYIDNIQHLNNITIYPSKYVASSFEEINKENFALHCTYHSWYKPSIIQKIKSTIKKILNKKTNNIITIIDNFLKIK